MRLALVPALFACAPVALAICAVSGAVRAQGGGDAALMQLRGQHPLNSTFGLPAVAARPVRHAEWQITLEHANTFMGGVREDEVLLLDGESTELTLRHRRRLGACWQGEATLPFIAHSNGWADRAIDDWHQAFGLPDAERGTFPLFDLNYVWQDENGRRRELVEPTAGLGDVQFALQRSIGCQGKGSEGAPAGAPVGSRTSAIVRLGIKLPSGDPDALLGSGVTDIFADLQSPVWSIGPHWRAGAAIGALAPGDSALFADQRPLVVYGSAGLELRVLTRWRVLAQLDWHSPFHDSALRELGEPAASLGVGVRYLAGPGASVEVSIGEDALIDTAPDIVGRLAWTWHPRRALPPPPALTPARVAVGGAS